MPFPTGRETPATRPFGIFVVIWGTLNLIVAISRAFISLSISTRQIISIAISLIAIFAALTYSFTYIFKKQLPVSLSEKCLHFVLSPIVYLILGFISYMGIE
jgi:hypothetical protein